MSVYFSPFTFDFLNSLIDVDIGVTDVDCGTLYHAIKQAQASDEGIIYERVGRGSGLNTLGPGVQVGLTVELLGAWQLHFQTGNYTARIAGGNLIGGPGGDPIAYTAGVQTLLIQSAASTVVTSSGSMPTVSQIVDAIEADGRKVDEIHRLHGLKSGEPLQVSETARSSGSISQTISSTGGITTVTRS